MDQSVKEYLRRIGSKGGKAVAGTPQAKARAAKAAKARWAKRKQKDPLPAVNGERANQNKKTKQTKLNQGRRRPQGDIHGQVNCF